MIHPEALAQLVHEIEMDLWYGPEVELSRGFDDAFSMRREEKAMSSEPVLYVDEHGQPTSEPWRWCPEHAVKVVGAEAIETHWRSLHNLVPMDPTKPWAVL